MTLVDNVSDNAPDAAGMAEADAARWARALPSGLVAEAWREASPWLALRDARVAGTRYLRLDGLLHAEAADALRRAVRTLPFVILKTDLVAARRCLIDESAPPEVTMWLEALASDPFRSLAGLVLGRALPPGLVVNAWRLHAHDMMGVHPDGVFYRGTVSVGLNPVWEPDMGGAIAFGTPTEAGFEVAERWFPRLGDVLLFAPDVDTWHAVEPVVGQHVRLSLTGWWVAPENALSNRAAVGGRT